MLFFCITASWHNLGIRIYVDLSFDKCFFLSVEKKKVFILKFNQNAEFLIETKNCAKLY